MSNPIAVVGTIATPPKRIVAQSGVALCTFRLASGDRRYDREQGKWIDGETNWFGVTAFRTLAEHASASLRKGQRVIVFGRLRIRRWENGEKSGLSVDIEAEALGHDLRWGVSQFEKRSGPAETEEALGSAGTTGTGLPSEQRADEPAQPAWIAVPEGPGAEPAASESDAADQSATERESGDGFLPVAA